MNTPVRLRVLFILVLWLMPGAGALAQWELDSEQSSINFVSIKNDAIGELHHFESLVGFIGEDGTVQVNIDLSSVQTLIDIRNERMRELLFETAEFPTASVTAELEPALLEAIEGGGTITTELPITLSLHGLERTLSAPLVAVAREERLQVFSARPVLVNAADFGLEAGVKALQEVAGLKAISDAVPVTLHLVFKPAQ